MPAPIRYAAGAIVAILLAGNAHAAEWADQLSGLNGVAFACVTSSDQDYAEQLCDDLGEAAQKALQPAGVTFERLGLFVEGGPEPAPPAFAKRPLDLTLFIRGTTGATIAVSVRLRASVTYAAAVEAGSDGPGRVGELVLWEQAAVASGPQTQVAPALAQHMATKLNGFLAHVAEHVGTR